MKTRAIRGGRKARRARKGFSLVEIIVAMGLLSIILMGLARVTFQMAAASRSNDMVAKRNAVLVQEANRYNMMTFASIATSAATDLTFGDFTFRRTVTVTPTTSTQSQIKIVIVPYIGGVLTTSKKDSVFVYRTNPPGSPLCVGC
jgi:prepilin-type N-terminal cleavage/methylation domain-containing protein